MFSVEEEEKKAVSLKLISLSGTALPSSLLQKSTKVRLLLMMYLRMCSCPTFSRFSPLHT